VQIERAAPLRKLRDINIARRNAMLDALWRASVGHAATTPAVFLLGIANDLRGHPDFDSIGLQWIEATRRCQPADAKSIAGRAAINRLIDRIVAAFDAAFADITTAENSENNMNFPTARTG
jgi:hypothetical protein